MILEFVDRVGRADTVEIPDEPATRFNHRISADEAARLLAAHGDQLPFEIMAEGYGDDEDSCGLTFNDLDPGPLGVTLRDPIGWAPYEIWDVAGTLRPESIDWHCPGDDAEHWEKSRWAEDGGTWVLCGHCGSVSPPDDLEP